MEEFVKGKVIFTRMSGLYGIKTEDKKVYIAFMQETTAKIKTGKSVLFQIGGQDVFIDGARAKHRHALNVRNNSLPAELQDQKLRDTVREYYEYLGDRRIHLYGIVTNKKSGYRMLLVHFVDVDDIKMSSLMQFQKWGDGHYDVTEMFTAPREEEQELVDDFVNSQDYV